MLPAGPAAASHVERGSRFLASVEECRSVAEGLAVRDVERRRTYDATHHVWAVRLADGSFRYDDDGEPAGTGGRTILAEIDSAGLVDVVCVVTRYFGGTKLGAGGLARAYGLAAARALESVPKRRVRRGEIRCVTYGFEDTGAVARVLMVHGAVRDGDVFSEAVCTRIRIPTGTADRLNRVLKDATRGRVSLDPDSAPPAVWIGVAT
ncbi:MAG: YigZ family protein [Gemmatimonadales bacterium]|nr:MAG: YigZ family protein [Gemmatimonadales bacterium]